MAKEVIMDAGKPRHSRRTADVVSNAPHRDEAQRLAGHEQRRFGQFDGANALSLLGRAIESDARGVQERRRKRVLLLDRDVLIARALFRERIRRSAWRPTIHLSVIESVAA